MICRDSGALGSTGVAQTRAPAPVIWSLMLALLSAELGPQGRDPFLLRVGLIEAQRWGQHRADNGFQVLLQVGQLWAPV